MQIEFTDRYKATGTPYPKKETMCVGQCEGMGCVPIFMKKDVKLTKKMVYCEEEKDPKFVALWKEAHRYYRLKMIIGSILFWKEKPWKLSRLAGMWKRFDGYHFVICPDCGGTRKRIAPQNNAEGVGEHPTTAPAVKPEAGQPA